MCVNVPNIGLELATSIGQNDAAAEAEVLTPTSKSAPFRSEEDIDCPSTDPKGEMYCCKFQTPHTLPCKRSAAPVHVLGMFVHDEMEKQPESSFGIKT